MSKLPQTKAIIATRGSKLAVWQADYIIALLSDKGLQAEKLIIKTKGDKVLDRFLHEIGGKGVFIKELETALLEGKADLAMHSLKDMPAKLPPSFTLAAVLKRHSSADLMIFNEEFLKKVRLPEGPMTPQDLKNLGECTIGTASLRRSSVLSRASSDLKVKGVRGNVDSRLAKLAAGEWDALILAEASLDRLNLKPTVTSRQLDPEWFIPCAAQGALAIETATKSPMTAWLPILECQQTRKQVDIERKILERLGGDCTMPVGVHVTTHDDYWRCQAAVYGKNNLIAQTDFKIKTGFPNSEMADKAILDLKAQNVAKVLESLDIEIPEEVR